MPSELPERPFDSVTFLKNLTTRPGIYKMFNDQGDIIYVGEFSILKVPFVAPFCICVP